MFSFSSRSRKSLLLEKAHLGDQATRLAIPGSTIKMGWVPLSYHFTSPAFVSPYWCDIWTLDTLQTSWASGPIATCRTGQMASAE